MAKRSRQIDTPWGHVPATKKEQRSRRQLSLGEAKTWGGRRRGTGRKKKDPQGRDNVSHGKRPLHYATTPVHVTLRAAKGLPSFRAEVLEKLLRRAIEQWGSERAKERRDLLDHELDGKARFRVVHYSIQSTHLHLIVEAQEHRELTSGLRSLVIRVAMRVNKLLGRARGKVWSDRYHREDLTCPSQVRNTMVYVLKNHVKHGQAEQVGRMDPFSSARWFDGWIHREVPAPTEASPVAPPSTWLLEEGWRRTRKGRYLHPDEKPVLRKAA
jgi:putative transposase